MGIAGAHRNRFVHGEFLYLLDGDSGHRQPAAERTAVGVACVAGDLGPAETRYKPESASV